MIVFFTCSFVGVFSFLNLCAVNCLQAIESLPQPDVAINNGNVSLVSIGFIKDTKEVVSSSSIYDLPSVSELNISDWSIIKNI